MPSFVSFSRKAAPYSDLFIQTADGSEHALIRKRTRVSFRYPLFCRRTCVVLLRFSVFLNFPHYSMSPFALLLIFLILSRYFVSMHVIFSFIFLHSFVTSNMKRADHRVFFVIPSDKCTTKFISARAEFCTLINVSTLNFLMWP